MICLLNDSQVVDVHDFFSDIKKKNHEIKCIEPAVDNHELKTAALSVSWDPDGWRESQLVTLAHRVNCEVPPPFVTSQRGTTVLSQDLCDKITLEKHTFHGKVLSATATLARLLLNLQRQEVAKRPLPVSPCNAFFPPGLSRSACPPVCLSSS